MTWLWLIPTYLAGVGFGLTLCMAAGRGPLRHPYVVRAEEAQE